MIPICACESLWGWEKFQIIPFCGIRKEVGFWVQRGLRLVWRQHPSQLLFLQFPLWAFLGHALSVCLAVVYIYLKCSHECSSVWHISHMQPGMEPPFRWMQQQSHLDWWFVCIFWVRIIGLQWVQSVINFFLLWYGSIAPFQEKTSTFSSPLILSNCLHSCCSPACPIPTLKKVGARGIWRGVSWVRL